MFPVTVALCTMGNFWGLEPHKAGAFVVKVAFCGPGRIERGLMHKEDNKVATKLRESVQTEKISTRAAFLWLSGRIHVDFLENSYRYPLL